MLPTYSTRIYKPLNSIEIEKDIFFYYKFKELIRFIMNLSHKIFICISF